MISIIVPIYNVEKYIGSLVNSLVKQTNKNFEVIFIDDGSTDESMQILKEIIQIKKYSIFKQFFRL